MALIRKQEIQKMNDSQINEKMAELKIELVKANVTANKSNAKTKEIKRAISRLLSMKTRLNKSSKKEGELKNK